MVGMEPTVRALAYTRVSTGDQVENGAGLDAQRTMLIEHAARRGWTLEILTDPGLSGRTMRRPALTEALARLDRGDAQILLAAKLDRVSRSVADFADLLDRSRRRGWRLVLLDLGVDTGTPAGEFVANTIANAAQYEGRLIGQRTREGLAAKRAQGVRLGRPQVVPDDVVRRILDARAAGQTFRRIASELEGDGVATARGGGTWHASTVRAVAHSQAATRLRG